MNEITVITLNGMFSAIAGMLAEKRDWLCDLDGVIGDADHGITMELGFSTVVKALAALDPQQASPTVVFNTAAKSFLNAVGASSGPLYATAFMRAGAALAGKSTVSDADMVAAFVAMARGIEERGKAQPGEKTMVDAWRPAADAARLAGADLAGCLAAASAAAKLGAEATRAMLASKGRASRLGERVLGHLDPGAASAALIIETMAGSLSFSRPG